MNPSVCAVGFHYEASLQSGVQIDCRKLSDVVGSWILVSFAPESSILCLKFVSHITSLFQISILLLGINCDFTLTHKKSSKTMNLNQIVWFTIWQNCPITLVSCSFWLQKFQFRIGFWYSFADGYILIGPKIYNSQGSPFFHIFDHEQGLLS